MTLNLADLFESIADAVPDRIALVSGATRLTFAALEARANRMAHALAARGVGAGDHVGLQLYNGVEYIETTIAAFKLRAVPVNINYRYVGDELRFLYDNADLRALVFQRELAPHVAPVAPSIRGLGACFAVADGSGAADPVPDTVDYEQALAAASPVRDFAPRSGEDLYVIYTGGTTGMPRGVMWRHADVFYAGLQGGNPGGPPLARAEDVPENARKQSRPMTILPAAPLIHGAAQWAAWIALLVGGKVVLVPGKSFDARRVCLAIAAEEVTTMTLVGDAMVRPLVDTLRADPGAFDLSTLMVISSAGAILSDSIKEQLQQLLPATMILNSFGASETGHQGTALPMGDPGSPGRPAFFMDATTTVLGDDLQPVKPGSGAVGRLARRGHLPIGYYKDAEKSAATFITVGDARYVVPGDLATIEADGRIVVLGRGAVCINSGGEKIYPEEVEVALKAHPAVLDAVVVGIPDERWGERVAAVVLPRPGTEASLTLSAIQAHCRERVAGYKVPRVVRLVGELLRHPSGKPDYRWAREAALRERA